MVKQYVAAWTHGEKERSSLHSCTGGKGGIANHIMDLRSVVGSDNPTPFFFFSVPIKGIRCLKHGFIPQHEHGLSAHLTLLKPECDLAVLVAVRKGLTATGMLVSAWDSAGEEEFAEKGIVECHKARSSVVLRSVILQELLADGTLPPAPRWWYGVVQGCATTYACCCAKSERN